MKERAKKHSHNRLSLYAHSFSLFLQTVFYFGPTSQ